MHINQNLTIIYSDRLDKNLILQSLIDTIMDSKARLIHKTNMSYLQTSLPVTFYGLPDGKVYLVYSRFYEIDYKQSGQEFVFATHDEFSYDYNTGELYLEVNSEKLFPVFPEMVDKPEPKIRIFKVYRNLKSYGEAQRHMNKMAEEILKEYSSRKVDTVD